MSNVLFSIFPNERFVDLGLYQYGWEQCEPLHSYGPYARNHYLFHYVISGAGTLMSTDSKGMTNTYHIKSGEGFLIHPKQVNKMCIRDSLYQMRLPCLVFICHIRHGKPG